MDASVSGNIEVAGDIDYFAFPAQEGSIYLTITIETTAGSLSDSFLHLYDGGGAELDSNDDGGVGAASKIEWIAPSAGTYYAAVRDLSNNRTGTYQLLVTETVIVDDHGNDIASATSASVNTPYASNIEVGGDVDYFAFPAVANNGYVMETTLTSLSDSFLEFYDAGGTLLLSNDAGGVGNASKITWVAPSTATYYAKVRGFTGSHSGTYSFSVTETVDDHGNDIASATLISVNTTISAAIDVIGDIDYFAFPAQEGSIYLTITIETTLGTLSDSFLHLYNGSGTQLAANDAGGPGNASKIDWIAPSAGTYYAAVRGFSSSQLGTYDVLVTETVVVDDHGNDIASATSASVNTPYASNIEVGGDVDYFAFPAVANNGYVMETTLTTLSDSFLEFYDAGGTLLLSNDAGGVGNASKITWVAPSTATYYAKVRGFAGSHSGTYSFSVTETVDDHGNSVASATPISVGVAISAGVDVVSDIDYFSFPATSGVSYTLETTLVSLADSFLELYNGGGTLLAGNDASGVGNASKITWVAPSTATYYAAVRGFSSSQLGTYSLLVSAP
ncbi:MAG: hypothetical protein BZY88_09045 [SAR202 cluster bacterium Io17-Chloro-G9]|nr:MAG: hypothetical protein BZY88_09045 [SAR202 cluster bacterium Io17-Chloro-G9]